MWFSPSANSRWITQSAVSDISQQGPWYQYEHVSLMKSTCTFRCSHDSPIYNDPGMLLLLLLLPHNSLLWQCRTYATFHWEKVWTNQSASFGIHESTTWEVKIAKEFGCDVFLFNPAYISSCKDLGLDLTKLKTFWEIQVLIIIRDRNLTFWDLIVKDANGVCLSN